jgi:hypothetical protein
MPNKKSLTENHSMKYLSHTDVLLFIFLLRNFFLKIQKINKMKIAYKIKHLAITKSYKVLKWQSRGI